VNDMSKVIEPRTDQINADTLIPGPMTVTIKDVKIASGTEQPVTIALEETPLFYRPCKSMSRILVSAWGPDAKKYIGRSLTLYRDPTVKWGGMDVGGIRISHLSHIDGTMTLALTATRASRKPFTVKPLVVERPPSVDVDPDKAAGLVAARQGLDALAAWWKTLPKPLQSILKSYKDETLKPIAAEVEPSSGVHQPDHPARDAGRNEEPPADAGPVEMD